MVQSTTHHQLLPGAVPALATTVKQTGYLTLADRYGLMAAVLDESLPDPERRMINRILQAIQQGRLQVV